MSATKLRGNPVQRRQGIVVRGILMGLVNKRPAPFYFPYPPIAGIGG